MQFFNVRASNKGFTLTEMLVVMMMIGILSAIAAPSLLGLYNRTRLMGAVTESQGALREAQRQAIRKSRNCTVTLDNSANMVLGSCLSSGNRRLNGVTLRSSVSSFQFNIKGAITNSSGALLADPVVIVLSSPRTRTAKCLLVSAPLGFIKTGTYTGNPQSTLTDANCLPDS
jgi:prepilin-type N-terminal cleavage/methylation domain-containing protein